VHTKHSDGIFQLGKLVQIAKQKGLEIIGISDHAFSSKLSDQYQVTDVLDYYLARLDEAKNDAEGIDVRAGIEIDVSMLCGVAPARLPFDVLDQLDYALFEYVNTENEYWGRVGSRDIRELIVVRDRLTIPIGLAHNDMQQNFEGREEEIARQLGKNDIFVELNQSEHSSRRGVGRNTRDGSDYYCHFSKKLLDALRKYDVKVVLGKDTHKDEGLADLDDAIEFVRREQLHYHEMVA